MLQEAWEDSGKVYGYRKLHDDLRDQGETCSPNCVARLARMAGIKAQIGYKRRPGKFSGKPTIAIDNTLDRQFDVTAPDTAWVTDITYIKTYEGFDYLSVVIDLFSRRIVGWVMQSRQTTDLVLQALLMAVWLRKPKGKMLIHSDQGSQFSSIDWASFLKQHNLEHSMSRRENCHDNAVAERFFSLLKRERIRRKPNLANRVDEVTEQAVIKNATDFPAYGQARTSNELRKLGVFVSPSGVRSIWLRHDLANFKKRLKALEAIVAETGIILTEAQVQALEKKKLDDERPVARLRPLIQAIWALRTLSMSAL